MTIDPGLLLIDKEEGVTSHAAVLAARRRTGVRRIGHTGTLDPFATGLLLLCLGTLTRASGVFHALPKTYRATMRLGEETDTDDLTGTAVRTSEVWRALPADAIEDAVAARIGASEQVPSTFSAKRVAGVRAHERARAGRPVDLEPVRIVVHEADVLDLDLPSIDVRVTVSTGTYVRALARDIGRELGCGAHLTALRRTRIGPFRVSGACDVASLEEGGEPPGCWRLPAEALSWLPRRMLERDEVEDIGHGRPIPRGDVAAPEGAGTAAGRGPALGIGGDGVERIALVRGDRLLAIGEGVADRIRPRTVFPA